MTIKFNIIWGRIKAIVKLVVFPRLRGSYYYFTLKKVYMAPSRRQIILIRKYLKKKWKHKRFIIVEKALGVMNKKAPIILDIGGNVGYVARVYSELLTRHNGRVISFEPVDVNCLAFLWNTKGLNNIQLFSVGLGAVSESISLGIPLYAKRLKKDPENTGLLSASAKIDQEISSYRSSSYPLDVIGDGIIGKNESIAFVKIDVEGYELNAITGAMEMFQHHMPLLEIEFNPMTNSKRDSEEILQSLYRLGYLTFSEHDFSFDEANNVFFVDGKDLELVSLFQSFDFLLPFDLTTEHR